MRSAACIALVLAACARRPPAPMTPERAADMDPPFCLAGVVELGADDTPIESVTCWAELWACELVRAEVARLGSLFGVTDVGECMIR